MLLIRPARNAQKAQWAVSDISLLKTQRSTLLRVTTPPTDAYPGSLSEAPLILTALLAWRFPPRLSRCLIGAS